MALYLAARLAISLLRLMPLRLSYAVARACGTAAFYAWRGGRNRCIQNMMRVAGGDATLARTYARRSFACYGAYIVDFLRFGAPSEASTEGVLARVDFDGWQRIDDELAGNGVVFVTLHFGNWDLAGAAIAAHGLPISVVVDTFANARLNTLVVGARERMGMNIVPVERMGPGVLRTLRRNGVVGLLIDVPQPGTGVEVEFFGGTVAVPDGPARIALRTGATILAGGVARTDPASEQFTGFLETVAFVPSGERERDVRDLTQATMATLERMVRRHPEQWYIFRTFWPADADSGKAA